MRIDAHQHYWDPARGDYGWLTPDLAPLYRPFGPVDLLPLLARNGLDGTVLVQAAPSLAETAYLLAIAAATPSVLGVVGWVDFEAGDAADQITVMAERPLLKGLRPMVQDLPDPDWLARPALDAAFDAMATTGLAFDALVKPRNLPSLLARLDRAPDLRVVVDHGAKPDIAGGGFDRWAGLMREVAGHPGVHCKLSGLVTEASPGWTPATLYPYVDHLLTVFGPDRLMFGSDWPVLILNGSYDSWCTAATHLTAHLSDAQQTAVFGGNAQRFYRLTPRTSDAQGS